jgi:hypothetical protein
MDNNVETGVCRDVARRSFHSEAFMDRSVDRARRLLSQTRAAGAFTDVTAPASYADLMSLHGPVFIEAAYQVILGRRADPIGLSYYSDRLRAGYSRTSVLDQLARSSEVNDGWDQVPGLLEAVRRYRRSRSLHGWKLALTDLELGRTPAIRRARALLNSIGSDQQRLARKLEDLSDQQETMKYLISNFETTAATEEADAAARWNSRGDREFRVPELRSRRIDEIRPFDLAPAARAVVDALRF